jgi:hypothetical protein
MAGAWGEENEDEEEGGIITSHVTKRRKEARSGGYTRACCIWLLALAFGVTWRGSVGFP